MYNHLKLRKYFLIMIIALLSQLLACSSSSPKDLAKDEPLFLPEKVFLKKMRGEGAIFDRFGDIQTTFVIDLEGEPYKDDGVKVKELLQFQDGKKETREYLFTKLDNGKYKATSESGLVGEAEIESVGNILRWKYIFEVPYNGKTRHMRFDDWMYLQKNGTIINRAKIYWWGFRVAELFMVVRPSDVL